MRLHVVLGEHSLPFFDFASVVAEFEHDAQQPNLSIRESFVSCDVSNDPLEHFDKLFCL